MAKRRRKEWNSDEEALLVETVLEQQQAGKPIRHALTKAAKVLKRSRASVAQKYRRIEDTLQKYRRIEDTLDTISDIPAVGKSSSKLEKKKSKTTEVNVSTLKTKGSFGMGAICEFGVVTLSADLLTISFHEDSTVKVEQTKNGMTISKA